MSGRTGRRRLARPAATRSVARWPWRAGTAGRASLARPLLAVVRGYQLVRAGRPSPCRFDPSCSAYALDALEPHGAARGACLAAAPPGSLPPLGWPGLRPRAREESS